MEHTNDQTGAFSHCAASANYVNGAGTLFVFVASDYSWGLGVYRQSISFSLGSNVPVRVSFDRVGPYALNALAQMEHFINVKLPTDNVTVEAFKAARNIYVTTPAERFGYNLTSTRELLPALVNCVHSHISAAKTPAPPDQPSQPPNPDAVAAREKLLSDAASEYSACINSNMKEIVPFSSEGAEVVAQVIVTKCADIQKHFTELTVALFGTSQSEAEKIVAEGIAERKKSIIADIVTFRAELTKRLMSQPRNPAPEVTSTPSDQGL